MDKLDVDICTECGHILEFDIRSEYEHVSKISSEAICGTYRVRICSILKRDNSDVHKRYDLLWEGVYSAGE